VSDSPVVEFARKNGISSIYTPPDLASSELIKTLSAHHADLFVVVAFRILPESVFSIPPLGTINIHASLLPRYRGPAPIQRAIAAGEAETGVTVFRIDAGIDTGAILSQERVNIGPEETTPGLYRRLSELGSLALIDALSGLARGTTVPQPQNNAGACGAPKLRKEEARIDWRQPSKAIFNKIRAFKPFPGTYVIIDQKRLGITWGLPAESKEREAPGTIVRVEKDFFDVQCGTGVLKVYKVKPEGRPEMTVHDFLLGNSVQEGTVIA
jgi:methionyl-tRNA formyltransferase